MFDQILDDIYRIIDAAIRRVDADIVVCGRAPDLVGVVLMKAHPACVAVFHILARVGMALFF